MRKLDKQGTLYLHSFKAKYVHRHVPLSSSHVIHASRTTLYVYFGQLVQFKPKTMGEFL